MNHLILVDYGGVLGFDHIIKNEEKLARKLGLTITEMNNRLSEKSVNGRLYREHKLSEVEFWKLVSSLNNVDECSASNMTSMWMDTYSLNEEMMDYLQILRQNEKVGILTNIDEGRSKLLEEIVNIDVNLDFYFPSYRFGLTKDNLSLWKILKEKLQNYKVIYVDDREEHVQSAESVGWIAIKYDGLELLKSRISIALDQTV